MNYMDDIEIPDLLPEIKYIDISNEKYQKIVDLFTSDNLEEDLRECQKFINQPERLKRADTENGEAKV